MKKKSTKPAKKKRRAKHGRIPTKQAQRGAFPVPHAGQTRFLALPGRHRIAVCGRRFGKDVMGALAANDEVIAGGHALWIEPTLDQAHDAAMQFWEYVEKDLQTKTNPAGAWQYKATQQEFSHRDGGKLRFRSALVGHGLRGRTWTLILINEAADVDEKVWRTHLAPTLLTTNGRAIILGTPHGKGNWLWALFCKAAKDTNWSRLQAKTSDNPLIKLKDLEAFKSEMTEAEFREEFEAEFIDLHNAIFPDIEEHARGGPRRQGRPQQKHATGIDVGQTAHTVAISIETQTHHAAGLSRWNNQPWAITEARLRKHIRAFPGKAGIDATGIGSGTAEELADVADPYTFTPQVRAMLLRNLAKAWEENRLTICNEPQLCHELRCMIWEREGTPPHAALVARSTIESTDCVMALAIGWHVLQTRGDAPYKQTKTFTFA